MSAQPENQQMEGANQDPATEVKGKGKGKASEGDVMEESMDDDSSDESGVEDQVYSPPKWFNLAQSTDTIALGWRR